MNFIVGLLLLVVQGGTFSDQRLTPESEEAMAFVFQWVGVKAVAWWGVVFSWDVK